MTLSEEAGDIGLGPASIRIPGSFQGAGNASSSRPFSGLSSEFIPGTSEILKSRFVPSVLSKIHASCETSAIKTGIVRDVNKILA